MTRVKIRDLLNYEERRLIREYQKKILRTRSRSEIEFFELRINEIIETAKHRYLRERNGRLMNM